MTRTESNPCSTIGRAYHCCAVPHAGWPSRARLGVFGLVFVVASCGGGRQTITRTFVEFKVRAKTTVGNGELGPGVIAFDPIRKLLFVSMGCPGDCAREGVWVLD